MSSVSWTINSSLSFILKFFSKMSHAWLPWISHTLMVQIYSSPKNFYVHYPKEISLCDFLKWLSQSDFLIRKSVVFFPNLSSPQFLWRMWPWTTLFCCVCTSRWISLVWSLHFWFPWLYLLFFSFSFKLESFLWFCLWVSSHLKLSPPSFDTLQYCLFSLTYSRYDSVAVPWPGQL